MNCDGFDATIDGWLRSALDDARRAAFARHLATCAPCRERAQRHADFCCRTFVGFLARHVDGELAHEERDVLEVHLRICTPCVEYLESYKVTIELAHRARGGDAGPTCDSLPPELLRSILDALEKR